MILSVVGRGDDELAAGKTRRVAAAEGRKRDIVYILNIQGSGWGRGR